jgi:hypothetical protein
VLASQSTQALPSFVPPMQTCADLGLSPGATTSGLLRSLAAGPRSLKSETVDGDGGGTAAPVRLLEPTVITLKASLGALAAARQMPAGGPAQWRSSLQTPPALPPPTHRP